jgi:hypothetical protein
VERLGCAIREDLKGAAAEIDQSCLQLLIVETSVDLSVKFVDDLNRRLLARTEAKYRDSPRAS